jgi:hypothetical protein
LVQSVDEKGEDQGEDGQSEGANGRAVVTHIGVWDIGGKRWKHCPTADRKEACR